jgi:hypothetical protein
MASEPTKRRNEPNRPLLMTLPPDWLRCRFKLRSRLSAKSGRLSVG